MILHVFHYGFTTSTCSDFDGPFWNKAFKLQQLIVLEHHLEGCYG